MVSMTTTTRPGARHSKTADLNGPKSHSPFRSTKDLNRIKAAHAMIRTREQEIATLEALLDKAADKATQKRLTTRLQATHNNLRSWQRYLQKEGAYREPRAVITPKPGA